MLLGLAPGSSFGPSSEKILAASLEVSPVTCPISALMFMIDRTMAEEGEDGEGIPSPRHPKFIEQLTKPGFCACGDRFYSARRGEMLLI